MGTRAAGRPCRISCHCPVPSVPGPLPLFPGGGGGECCEDREGRSGSEGTAPSLWGGQAVPRERYLDTQGVFCKMPGGHRVTTGLREREGLAGQQSLPQCRDIFWGALEGMVGAEKLVLGKKKIWPSCLHSALRNPYSGTPVGDGAGCPADPSSLSLQDSVLPASSRPAC